MSNTRACKKRIKELTPKIEEAFNQLDTDGTGTLTRKEVEECAPHFPKAIRDLVTKEDMDYLFDVLDEDGSGEVEMQEFLECIFNLATSDVPLEMQKMHKMVSVQYKKMCTLEKSILAALTTFTSKNNEESSASMSVKRSGRQSSGKSSSVETMRQGSNIVCPAF